MLVLSRRANEQVVFPHLGISVEVVRISGKTVRIGIDAPPDISVLRGELAEKKGILPNKALSPQQIAHSIQTRLQGLTEQLHGLRAQLGQSEDTEAEEKVVQLLRELDAVDSEALSFSAGGADEVLAKASAPRRALLVEDNNNESRLLAEYLKVRKLSVETAFDGADALHYLARNERPDCILLDMNMPRFDGPWTVREIRGNSKYDGMRVFAVSGMDPRELGVEIGLRGVDRWFRKPIDPEALVEAITGALPKPSLPV